MVNDNAPNTATLFTSPLMGEVVGRAQRERRVGGCVEFVAGCDDATASSRRGYLYLQFSRTAPDLLTAVVSALSNVSKAGIGGRVMREEMKDAAETIHQVNLVLETIHSKPLFNKIAPMVHEAVRYSQHGRLCIWYDRPWLISR